MQSIELIVDIIGGDVDPPDDTHDEWFAVCKVEQLLGFDDVGHGLHHDRGAHVATGHGGGEI